MAIAMAPQLPATIAQARSIEHATIEHREHWVFYYKLLRCACLSLVRNRSHFLALSMVEAQEMAERQQTNHKHKRR
jgi:hypothetical protein